MSLKSITIRNFRQFNELKLDGLANVTLIGGRNGAGKTSILEGVYIAATEVESSKFVELELRRRQPDQQHFQTPNNVIRHQKSRLKSDHTPWAMLFPMNGKNSAMEFEYTNRECDKFDLTLRIPDQNTSLSSSAGKLLAQLRGASTGNFGSGNFLLCETQCPVGKAHKHETLIFYQNGQTQQYALNAEHLPAPHAVGAGGVHYISTQDWRAVEVLNTLFSDVRKNGAYDDFVKILQVMDPTIRAVEILEYKSNLQLHIMSGDHTVPISHSGDGALRIATYAATILGAKDSVILIDEIENGLHFSILNKLWKSISGACQISNSQVVASTHSLECIAAAARNVPNNDFAYFRIEKPVEGISHAIPYDSDEAIESFEKGIPIR